MEIDQTIGGYTGLIRQEWTPVEKMYFLEQTADQYQEYFGGGNLHQQTHWEDVLTLCLLEYHIFRIIEDERDT